MPEFEWVTIAAFLTASVALCRAGRGLNRLSALVFGGLAARLAIN